MTKQEHIDYWIKSATDDWETVLSLFVTRRYTHYLFFAHLVLEKWCKAHWVKDNIENFPPRIHNLVKIAKLTNLGLSDEQMDFLRQFNDFQLEGRYPDYQFEIYKRCNANYTKQLLEQVNEIKLCLQEKM